MLSAREEQPGSGWRFSHLCQSRQGSWLWLGRSLLSCLPQLLTLWARTTETIVIDVLPVFEQGLGMTEALLSSPYCNKLLL